MWPMDDFPEINVHSYIGVIIAIVGNILISVALNVQKYAHNQLQPATAIDSKLLQTSLACVVEEDHTRNRNDTRQFQSLATIPSYHDSEDDEGGMENAHVDTHSYQSSQCSRRSSIHSNLSNHNSDTSAQSDTITAPNRAGLDEFYSTDSASETEYLRSKAWWLGMMLMILGECGNFMAYGYAQASIVAPLGTVALVSNVILAPLMLKEPFRKRDLAGVVIAIIGTVVVVINSKENETKLTPEAVVAALLQTQFIVYFIVCCVLLGVLIPLSDTIGSEHIFIDLSIVAIFGGYTVLATKGVSSLVSLSFYKMFTYPIAYLLVFVMVSTAVLQIKFLNKSLQRFDSTQVIPTQFVLFTTSAIVGSGILYNDFDEMDFNKGFNFLTGCCMTFLGVYFITSKRDIDESLNPAVVASAEWALAPQTHFTPIQHRPSLDSLAPTRAFYAVDNNRSGSLMEQGRIPVQSSGYVIPQPPLNRPIRNGTVVESFGQNSTTPLLGNSRHSISGSKDQLSFITSSMHNALSAVGSAVGTHHTALLSLETMYGHTRKNEDRRGSEQSLSQNPTHSQRPPLGSRSSSACSGVYPQYSLGTHPSSTSSAPTELNYGTSSQSSQMQFPRPNTGLATDPRYQAPHLQERSLSQDSPYKQPNRKISMPHISKEQKEPKTSSMKIKTSGATGPRRKGDRHMFPSPSEQDFVSEVARSFDSISSSTPKAAPKIFPGTILSASPPSHVAQGSEYAFQTLKSPVSASAHGNFGSYQSDSSRGNSAVSPVSDQGSASLPPLPPTDSGSHPLIQQQPLRKKKKRGGSVTNGSDSSSLPLQQTKHRQSLHGDDDKPYTHYQ
ncbi:hypothetical protein BGX26_008018 [Mortierella sp. AD094]|nr:hypothetical protein BGX26_008018 [Mortierella sp. AD094]